MTPQLPVDLFGAYSLCLFISTPLMWRTRLGRIVEHALVRGAKHGPLARLLGELHLGLAHLRMAAAIFPMRERWAHNNERS
jgi:hypothetical protein